MALSTRTLRIVLKITLVYAAFLAYSGFNQGLSMKENIEFVSYQVQKTGSSLYKTAQKYLLHPR